MAKLLARSKSLRQLRPSKKDSKEPAVPGHDLFESRLAELERQRGNFDDDRHVPKPPTYVPIRGDYTIDSADTIARPKTASEAMDRRKLMTVGSPISVTSGQDTFNFPTPLRKAKKPSSNPTSARMEFDSPHIGIALGSPSHAAHFQGTPSSMTMSPTQYHLLGRSGENSTPLSTPGRSQITFSSRSTDWRENEVGTPNESTKPRLSRWRSLGGLFARRPSQKPSPQLEYQTLSQSRSPHKFDMPFDGHTSPWQGEGASTVLYQGSPAMSESRWAYESPKKSKNGGKFGLGRSQTAPTTRNGGRSPQPPPKDIRSPVLDVDIPTTQMERYSVMFNGVLGKKRSTPSLLERRQANAIERKPVPGTAMKVRCIHIDLALVRILTGHRHWISQAAPNDEQQHLSHRRHTVFSSFLQNRLNRPDYRTSQLCTAHDHCVAQIRLQELFLRV
jgi:hypothetical protein